MIVEWTEENFPEARQVRHTHAQLTAFVAIVWGEYFPGEVPPRVRGGRTEQRAETNGVEIRLPPRAQTLSTTLHEVAHIMEIKVGRSGEHTPEFVTTVSALLVRYLGAQDWVLRESARRYGLLGG